MSMILLSIRNLRILSQRLRQTPISRKLHASTIHLAKPLPPRQTIPESDLVENFLKGSGPGGQKINKTSSAVQLKHIPTGLVIKSQATRSRSQNRKYARQILAEKLDVLAKGDGSRTAIKEGIKAKKKASAGKKSRRKYRALEAEKDGRQGVEDGREQEGGEGDNGDCDDEKKGTA